MKWLLAAAVFFLASAAPANPPGEDLSVQELVMHYIHLPCEALEYSYGWMYRDLNRITNAYQTCISMQDTSEDPRISEDPWFGLQCVYIKQSWQLRMDHIQSVRKAYDLMCYEGERREKQYEIDF